MIHYILGILLFLLLLFGPMLVIASVVAAIPHRKDGDWLP